MIFLLPLSSRAMRPRILGKSKAISGICALVKLFSNSNLSGSTIKRLQTSPPMDDFAAHCFWFSLNKKAQIHFCLHSSLMLTALRGAFVPTSSIETPYHRCLTGNKLASQVRKNSKPQTLATTINRQAKKLFTKEAREVKTSCEGLWSG